MVCFLDIISEPSGAKVYISFNYVGTTPIDDYKIYPGFYNIRIEKSGYETWTHLNYEIKTTDLAKTLRQTLNPVAVPTGSIKFKSNPTGAKVYVDDRYRGETTITVTGLAAGRYYWDMKKSGYADESGRVTVEAGKETLLSVNLSSMITPPVVPPVIPPEVPIPPPEIPPVVKTGISVNSAPTGAKIFIDGADTGKVTPAEIEKLAGTYKIKLTLEGYKDYEKTETLTTGVIKLVNYALEKVVIDWVGNFLTALAVGPLIGFNLFSPLTNPIKDLILAGILAIPGGEVKLEGFARYLGRRFAADYPAYKELEGEPEHSITLLAVIGLLAGILGFGGYITHLRKETPEPLGMSVWAMIEAKDWEGANIANKKYIAMVNRVHGSLVSLLSWLNPFTAAFARRNMESQLASAEAYQRIIDDNLAIKKGTLKIETVPVDAKIAVEGQYIATGIFKQELEVGNYKVVVSAFGYIPQEYTATVIEAKETYFKTILLKEVEELGTLKIESEPIDAKITVEGAYPAVGIFRENLAPGAYKVVVSAFGYIPQEATLEVVKGKETYMKFILTKEVEVKLPEYIRVYVRDIVDGDTIETDLKGYDADTGNEIVLPEYAKSGHASIRIVGINSPEKSPKGEILCTDIEVYKVEKAWTDEARNVLLYLNDRQVTLFLDPAKTTDIYGRILARVEYGGRDIGLSQIKAGLACWYFREKHKHVNDDLYKAETLKAMNARTGMWSDLPVQPPVPPEVPVVPVVPEVPVVPVVPVVPIVPVVPTVTKILITSEPTNAKIWIDEVYVKHWTPSDEKELKKEIALFSPGKHKLKITKAGLIAEQEITIIEGAENKWHLVLGELSLAKPEIPTPIAEATPITAREFYNLLENYVTESKRLTNKEWTALGKQYKYETAKSQELYNLVGTYVIGRAVLTYKEWVEIGKTFAFG